MAKTSHSVVDYSKWDNFQDSEDDEEEIVALTERDIVAQDAKTVSECRAEAKQVLVATHEHT